MANEWVGEAGPERYRRPGCGHGECTTADTPCRYESGSQVIGAAETDAIAGGYAQVRLDAPRLKQWGPEDLDRCEHGRHSIDHCADCPGGVSSGNTFLLVPVPTGNDHPENVRIVDGRIEVRIGTMVRGEPIWVVVRDKPREAEVTSEEADGKLPCSECGHRVRPGRHTVAECTRFQIEDAEKSKTGSDTAPSRLPIDEEGHYRG